MTEERSEGEELPLRVGTLEIFFDLVFAFNLTQLTSVLATRLSWLAILQVLLVFGLLWWMYGAYAWLTNSRPPVHTTERLLLLVGMAGFLVVGLAIPRGFSSDGLELGIGYLTVVVVHAILYYRVNANILRIAPFNMASALLVILAGLVHNAAGEASLAAYLLWILALLVQLGSPLIVHPKNLFELRPAHFCERHSALIIVAIGESVAAIGIGAGSTGQSRSASWQLLAGAVLGLAVAAALWWLAFGSGDEERAVQVLSRASSVRRTALALSAYFYGNIPLLLGLVALAAGVLKAVLVAAGVHASPGLPARFGDAALLSCGAALFLAGDVIIRKQLGTGPTRHRAIAAALALATTAVGVAVNLDAQLAVVLVVLVLPLVTEPGSADGRLGHAGPGRRRASRAAGRAQVRQDRGVIDRYTLPEMGHVWSEAHKYELWCQIETLVLAAHARAGTVPAEAVAPVAAAPPPTPEAVAALEAVTGHDVIAFLSAWANNTTPREAAAYVHFGMTSSDLLDTALALQLAESTDLLTARCEKLLHVLREHALAHRTTLRPGRTHGIHAEPDVWGHRVADFAFAIHRCRDRLLRARQSVAVGKLSGPVGTYSNIDPAIESEVLTELGLRPADVATQVVLRDGIAEWVSVLALIASVCDAIAIEIRHGQRTEVAELAEPFGAGQKGSSAMPHKKNPVRAERISGLARIVRAQVVPVMEGVALWHERDISHSSTERIALPDAAIATDYLLEQTTGVMAGLVVDAARMLANLESSHGLIYTSAVLLELVAGGMSREDAYTLVQGAAMETWQSGADFRETLRKHAAVRGQELDEVRLDEVSSPERYVRRLGAVFDRLERLA